MNRDPENETNPGHEGFVSRWSRRKSNSRTDTTTKIESTPEPDANADINLDNLLEPTGASNEVTDLATTAPQEGGELTPETEELTEADLPPIESLDENSDYSAFMAPNVGTEIRNLALRKLFRSKVFNIRDGLDDYDEDFTTFEKLGDIITADMRHHTERKAKLLEEEQRLAEENASNADPDDDDATEAIETGDDELTAQAPDDSDGDGDATQAIDHGHAATEQHAATDSMAPDNAHEPLATNRTQPGHGKLRRRPDQT